jgi:hypothetical protein
MQRIVVLVGWLNDPLEFDDFTHVGARRRLSGRHGHGGNKKDAQRRKEEGTHDGFLWVMAMRTARCVQRAIEKGGGETAADVSVRRPCAQSRSASSRRGE